LNIFEAMHLLTHSRKNIRRALLGARRLLPPTDGHDHLWLVFTAFGGIPDEQPWTPTVLDLMATIGG